MCVCVCVCVYFKFENDHTSKTGSLTCLGEGKEGRRVGEGRERERENV